MTDLQTISSILPGSFSKVSFEDLDFFVPEQGTSLAHILPKLPCGLEFSRSVALGQNFLALDD